MASNKEIVKAWENHCQMVQQSTTLNLNETDKDVERRIARARKDYAFFVEYYFPHYAICKTAPFQIKAARKILQGRKFKGCWEWARGHAKSTHFTIFIPMWLDIQIENEINVMVLVSKSEDSAKALLGDLQAEYQHNQRFTSDFGAQYNQGSWEDGNFVTKGGLAAFARGRGQSPRGLRYRQNRPDYIAIDDADDDQMCRNPKRVKDTFDWCLEALFGAMDMGRGRFMFVGNRIGKVSLIALAAKLKGIHHQKVNVLDKKGQPSWFSKYSLSEINKEIAFMGHRRAQKEWFNNPIQEGTIFKEEWITYGKVPKLKDMDQLVLYADPSWKEKSNNDFKAARLWGRKGSKLYLLKSFVRQTSISAMVCFFYDVHESLPEGVSCQYYMEANLLQDLLLEEFTVEGVNRNYQLAIRGDKRKKPNKFMRIENTSPLYERGAIIYDEQLKDDEDTKIGTEQILGFEQGATINDDAPDADEGAIFILQKGGRTMKHTPIFGRREHKGTW